MTRRAPEIPTHQVRELITAVCGWRHRSDRHPKFVTDARADIPDELPPDFT
jgi:hypothetical protein